MSAQKAAAGASLAPAAFQKPCIRCLIRDLPQGAALSEVLRELIGRIPPEDRASPETVAERLAACESCEHLGQGTCRLCGCYVEHRAERKAGACPALPSRWKTS